MFKKSKIKHLLLNSFCFATLSLTQLSPLAAQDWSQQGPKIYGEASGDKSGVAVGLSADGHIIAIGANANDGNGTNAGHVRVYEYIWGQYVQRGQDLDGDAAGDEFGSSLALTPDGNTLAIGAPKHSGNQLEDGMVRVVTWDDSVWVDKGNAIIGEAREDRSGFSVSLSNDGNTLAIGATDNGAFTGHTRIYRWNGTQWNQLGNDIDGKAAGDESGFAVSLSANGNILAIGSASNDDSGTRAGQARVYEWNGTSWTQLGNDMNGAAAGDRFGKTLSLSADGHTLAVGGERNDAGGTDAGHIRVFSLNGNTWVQKGTDILGEAAGHRLGNFNGVDISADGNTLAAGTIWNDEWGQDAGHVRIFRWENGAWVQQGADIFGNAAGDWDGFAVRLSDDGQKVALGAPQGDGSNSATGYARIFLAPNDSVGASTKAGDAEATPVVEIGMTAYPNPTTRKVNVDLGMMTERGIIKVHNSNGMTVKEVHFKGARTVSVTMPDAAGIYFLEIRTIEGRAAMIKVLKQ